MPHLAAGLSHIYLHSSTQDDGWRLRAGFVLDEVLDVTFRPDGTYDMVCRLHALEGWEHELTWPPLTHEAPDDVEAALLVIQEQMTT